MDDRNSGGKHRTKGLKSAVRGGVRMFRGAGGGTRGGGGGGDDNDQDNDAAAGGGVPQQQSSVESAAAAAVGSLHSRSSARHLSPKNSPKPKAARPSYRVYNHPEEQEETTTRHEDDDDAEGAVEEEEEEEEVVAAVEASPQRLAKNIETSAGTSRLNRILRKTAAESDETAAARYYPGASGGDDNQNPMSNQQAGGGGGLDDYHSMIVKQERIVHVHDPGEVAAALARLVIPPLRVDASSMGGHLLEGYPDNMQQECLLCVPARSFESTGSETVFLQALQAPGEYPKHKRRLMTIMGGGGVGGVSSTKAHRANKIRYVVIARSTNNPVLDTPISLQELQQQQQQLQGNNNSKNKSKNPADDAAHQADYDAMFAPEGDDISGKDLSVSSDQDPAVLTEKKKKAATATNPPVPEDIGGNKDNDPSAAGGATGNNNANAAGNNSNTNNNTSMASAATAKTKPGSNKKNQSLEEEEVSSFPVLICLTINGDGTSPDIRKLIPLDQLTTVQDLHAAVLQLAFSSGDTVRLDFGHEDETKAAVEGSMDKERFIWSLLQIHAMLVTTVVERTSLATAGGGGNNMTTATKTYLPPLNVRNMDRAELQYVATVNGFLRNDEMIKTLLERQKKLIDSSVYTLPAPPSSAAAANANATNEGGMIEMEEMDGMAYDLIMGNFATRVSLFSTEDEQKDAEEVLNSTAWMKEAGTTTTGDKNKKNAAGQQQQQQSNSNALTTTGGSGSGGGGMRNITAQSIAERLGYQLLLRMRDLEGETCRRLIAWEDEKHYNHAAQQKNPYSNSNKLTTKTDERDTVDALALASLFQTLEQLDTELMAMEEWLQERAAAIKPLTDDCADIEEENRQLEQQWKSYDMLGADMRKLLTVLEIDPEHERVLKNPASVLSYEENGLVNVQDSEAGVDEIYEAGKALEQAIEYPKRAGGSMHLQAVSERYDALTKMAKTFCTALAQIIVTVMEQFKTAVVAGSDYGKVSKSDTHAMIARKVRDTQRKFQSSLLGYIKLIEILAALAPEMLPALRDAYSEMVAEGILMKKRMKGYFQALPARNSAYMNRVGKDIKDYYVPSLQNNGPNDGSSSNNNSGSGHHQHHHSQQSSSSSQSQQQSPLQPQTFPNETVNAPDIRAVLTELLPIIAREAYFTSALFGPSNKEQDGREKKRNFESVRAAVDHSSQHFRYYVHRTTGILPDDGGARSTAEMTVRGDPLLCLVASIYLNEAMDHYIDRDKKGGDHSLSLAYVRATILDLRKRCDKQWVVWVDKQLEWIRSHDGVPLTGKRAGIFPSFARFPVYLDHVVYCCKQGRDPVNYMPDMATIKVVNYYMQKLANCLLESLKECTARETTDQEYAAAVMQMENTYYFTQAMKQRGPVINDLFSKQVTKANAICKESTDAYLGWMIKREFRVLHELFSRISKLRKDVGDKEVILHVRKAEFVKILGKEAARDVLKEKIGVMFHRMEKHLSPAGGLVPTAWKALVKVLYEWFGRWEKLSTQIYRHKLDPAAVDVVRIAKAAGGVSMSGSKHGGGHGSSSAAVAAKIKAAGNTPGSSSAPHDNFGFSSILALGAAANQQYNQQHGGNSGGGGGGLSGSSSHRNSGGLSGSSHRLSSGSSSRLKSSASQRQQQQQEQEQEEAQEQTA